MSTLAYAALTSRREESPKGSSSIAFATMPATSGGKVGQPGVTPWIDALAALVPAEILAVHALVLGLATTTATRAGNEVTTITDRDTLTWMFFALCGASILLYALGHAKNFDRWDLIRMLIPPAAFTAWTMLLKSSAWDAIAPHMSTAARVAAGAIAALLLGALAAALARPADQKPPPPPDGGPPEAIVYEGAVFQRLRGPNGEPAQAPVAGPTRN